MNLGVQEFRNRELLYPLMPKSSAQAFEIIAFL